MSDIVESIGSSLIQHGTGNDRIYLMKLDPADLPDLLPRLDALASERGYGKIFAKVPAGHADLFVARGYEVEGRIPRFYAGSTEAAFLGKFLDSERRQSSMRSTIEDILGSARAKASSDEPALPPRYGFRPATDDDLESLASLYASVFASYPFPIDDPAYLRDTLHSHVCYFVAEHEGRIVAASSAEMDSQARNAEMTDFATHRDHRGLSLAYHLLEVMEPAMQERGIMTLYTIARALSPGMNITFARGGYKYGGTLTNNTQISGSIESMNLWYRALPVDDTESAR